MFDIGLWEMMVIGVVALVVLGPERLPKVARTAGHLMGRLQRYVAQVKSDINREMELSELNKVRTEFEQAAQSLKSTVETSAAQAEQELRKVEGDVERELNAATDTSESSSATHAAEPTDAALVPVPSVPPPAPVPQIGGRNAL
jgi:sec-independent protein translocase protein TatB